jgi:hypothetical protein
MSIPTTLRFCQRRVYSLFSQTITLWRKYTPPRFPRYELIELTTRSPKKFLEVHGYGGHNRAGLSDQGWAVSIYRYPGNLRTLQTQGHGY